MNPITKLKKLIRRSALCMRDARNEMDSVWRVYRYTEWIAAFQRVDEHKARIRNYGVQLEYAYLRRTK